MIQISDISDLASLANQRLLQRYNDPDFAPIRLSRGFLEHLVRLNLISKPYKNPK